MTRTERLCWQVSAALCALWLIHWYADASIQKCGALAVGATVSGFAAFVQWLMRMGQ